jgi:hypothetical protein
MATEILPDRGHWRPPTTDETAWWAEESAALRAYRGEPVYDADEADDERREAWGHFRRWAEDIRRQERWEREEAEREEFDRWGRGAR